MYDLAQLAGAIAVSSLGSVGLWTLVGKWLDRKAAKEDGELGRTREDLASEKQAHKICLERLDHLEARLAVVEAHHGSLLARWVKDAGKRLCWVNGRAMATIFGPLGYTRDEIDGRTFHEILDDEAATEIDRLDRAALAQPGMAVSSMIRLHPSLPVMMVVKVAGVGRDQELIYEGHAFRTEDIEMVQRRGDLREEEQLGLSILRLADGRAEQNTGESE